MKATLLCALAAGMLLSGCGVHDTVPARSNIVVVEGKRFAVPQGAIVSDHIATKREIDFFKRSGVDSCKQGDITWEMPEAQKRIGKAIASGDGTAHKKLAEAGLIGCASAL